MSFSKQLPCLSFHVGRDPGTPEPSIEIPQSKKKQNEIRAKQKEEASKQVFAPWLQAATANNFDRFFLAGVLFSLCLRCFFLVRLLFSFFNRVSDVCCITMPGFMTQCKMWFVQDFVFHKCGSLKVLP